MKTINIRKRKGINKGVTAKPKMKNKGAQEDESKAR